MSLIEVFMKEKRVCKQYSRSFKEEAVALVTEQGLQRAVDSLNDSQLPTRLHCFVL